MAKAGKETSSSLDEAIIPSRLSLLLLLLKKVFSHFLTLLPSHAGPQKDEGRKKGGGERGGPRKNGRQLGAEANEGRRALFLSLSLSLSLLHLLFAAPPLSSFPSPPSPPPSFLVGETLSFIQAPPLARLNRTALGGRRRRRWRRGMSGQAEASSPPTHGHPKHAYCAITGKEKENIF